MKTVRTTFLPNQKNRTAYFNADEAEDYFSAMNETPPTELQKKLHRQWGIVINAAYDTGFRDGIEEMLERIAKEIEDGKVD